MVNSRKRSFYEDDLAYIHDAGFGDLARNAAKAVLGIVKKRGINRGLIVDVGCGSGILAQRLSRAGFHVLGIDVSEPMLRLGRKRAPEANFKRKSLFAARFPACIAVTAIGEPLNYQTGTRASQSISSFFRRVQRALAPGGVFVLDVAGPGRGLRDTRIHSAGRDWAILVEKTEKRGILERRITIFRRVGNTYRRTEEVHHQKLYSPEEIRLQLRRAGFQVRRLRGYGDLAFQNGHAGFEAIKTSGSSLVSGS